jgi:23S rRNA (cytidine2498-2'-O)-methyltransferase
MKRFLLFCRPGFEADCAAEVNERFAECGWSGSAQSLEPHGLVGYQGEYLEPSAEKRAPVPSLASLIFARHRIEAVKLVKDLPAKDRATPLAEAFLEATTERTYRALVLEHPDTNEGRALATFCKKFVPALGNAMKRLGFSYDPQAAQAPAFHVVFVNYEKAYVGIQREPKGLWKSGIPRLKFPEESPSRSVLKLEEALLGLLSDKERTQLLEGGGTAVDLGASPGGWTFHLVQKGFFVHAVDNGRMDEQLMASGMVDHHEVDAYKFKPKQAVALLVCDMVDKPQKVVTLMARWLREKQCRWMVFNLKLPMKKRYEEWETCLALFWRENQLDPSAFELRVKHLYHNREEITVLVKPRGR